MLPESDFAKGMVRLPAQCRQVLHIMVIRRGAPLAEEVGPNIHRIVLHASWKHRVSNRSNRADEREIIHGWAVPNNWLAQLHGVNKKC